MYPRITVYAVHVCGTILIELQPQVAVTIKEYSIKLTVVMAGNDALRVQVQYCSKQTSLRALMFSFEFCTSK